MVNDAKMTRPRLDTLDLVRGIVIALMALDHTKDFLQSAVDRERAINLAETTPFWFFTRWVTHFCAPTFVLLAGTGAWFGLRRGTADLAKFLFTRGLFLAALELTVLHWFWFLDFSYEELPLQVFWAIGTSMMLLAFFVWLPSWAVGLLGLAVICGHNALDPIRARHVADWSGSGLLGKFWAILHSFEPIRFDVAPHVTIFPAYGILAWFGVMALGYGLGPLWSRPLADRKITLYLLGTVFLMLFVVIRYLNRYGDPKPWQLQDSWEKTVIAFLHCEKYPPSLDYCLMTLGPALMALAFFDRPVGKLGSALTVFGSVPAFFYLIHLPALQMIGGLIAWLGVWMGWYASLSAARKTGLGFDLGTVYVTWIFMLFLLYWPCRWYANFKLHSKSAWLSYV